MSAKVLQFPGDKDTKPPNQFFENKIERFLSKKQIAEILSISVSFVNKLMAEEGLPYLKLGNCVRFRTSEVMAFLEKRKRP